MLCDVMTIYVCVAVKLSKVKYDNIQLIMVFVILFSCRRYSSLDFDGRTYRSHKMYLFYLPEAPCHCNDDTNK